MGHGAVVIDLAAEAGGNCEGTQTGEVVHTDEGVTIDGRLNLPSRMAEHASQLYARNVQSLLELMRARRARCSSTSRTRSSRAPASPATGRCREHGPAD